MEAIRIAGKDERGFSGRQRAEDGESGRPNPQGTPVAQAHRQRFDGKAALTEVQARCVAPAPHIQVGGVACDLRQPLQDGPYQASKVHGWSGGNPKFVEERSGPVAACARVLNQHAFCDQGPKGAVRGADSQARCRGEVAQTSTPTESGDLPEQGNRAVNGLGAVPIRASAGLAGSFHDMETWSC
jgi:hypothetical protein